MNIALIAALGKNRGIGFENKLIQRIREDMEWFKDKTMNKPVIMGRSTYESIGKPLEGRMNIVLTSQLGYLPHPDLVIAHSIKDALDMVRTKTEVMVIGGAKVYEQFLPLATRMYLTEFDRDLEADAFFPEFDRGEWNELLNMRGSEVLDFDYFFKIYQRKHKN